MNKYNSNKVTTRTIKTWQVPEQELMLKLHYYLTANKLNINNFIRYMRAKGFKSISRHFMYNIFRGKRFGISISILFASLEYCNISLLELCQVEVPEEYKRKYLK